MGVGDTAVIQFDDCPVGFCLMSLIDLPPVSEHDGWSGCQALVLVIGVTAIDESVHGLFCEASSGPRSMA